MNSSKYSFSLRPVAKVNYGIATFDYCLFLESIDGQLIPPVNSDNEVFNQFYVKFSKGVASLYVMSDLGQRYHVVTEEAWMSHKYRKLREGSAEPLVLSEMEGEFVTEDFLKEIGCSFPLWELLQSAIDRMTAIKCLVTLFEE